jgi:hypothetical protein
MIENYFETTSKKKELFPLSVNPGETGSKGERLSSEGSLFQLREVEPEFFKNTYI